MSHPGYPPQHPPAGYPPGAPQYTQGYPPAPGAGYPPPGPGYPGAPPAGYPAPGAGYPPAGAPPTGYPPAGAPPAGYPPAGVPPAGYPPAGYPPAPGAPPAGYPPAGAPPAGYPPPPGAPVAGAVVGAAAGSFIPHGAAFGAPPGAPHGAPPGAPHGLPPAGPPGTFVNPHGYAMPPQIEPRLLPTDHLYFPTEPIPTPEKDVERLMKPKSDDIVDILGTRSEAHLAQVDRIFGEKTKRSLKDSLKGLCSGHYGKLAQLVLTPSVEWDAQQLYEAMKGFGTHNTILIEVITGRSNRHLTAVKADFHRKYGKTLEAWVEKETSGPYRKTLQTLLTCTRDESIGPLPPHIAEQAAQRLYAAGEGKIGTNSDEFITILCHHNYRHLQEIDVVYQAKHKKSLVAIIEKETKDDFQRVLVALIDPGKFLAASIKDATHGAGTKDHRLCQLVVQARRTDPNRLLQAKRRFIQTYHEGMIHNVEDDTSGDYRKLLCRLLCCRFIDLIALQLREAMRGVGTDEAVLIRVLCNVPDKREVYKLDNAYMLDYGKRLMQAFEGELGGNLKTFMKAIINPMLDVHAAHDAITGVGTKEGVLIELLCCRPNYRIQQIAHHYQKVFKKSLVSEIGADTSFNLGAGLCELAKGTRREGMNLTQQQAQQLAQQLYESGEMRVGTNDRVFVQIFTTYSPWELQYIETFYRAHRGKGFAEMLEAEVSGDYKSMLNACHDPDFWVAKRLLATMDCIGTKDEELIRLIASRSKWELQHLVKNFARVSSKSLQDWITAETSGDYRNAMLTYLNASLAP